MRISPFLFEVTMNYLTNGDFCKGLPVLLVDEQGWRSDNGIFWVRGKPNTPNDCHKHCEVDSDKPLRGSTVRTGWQVGQVDYLRQTFSIPEPHQALLFHIDEAHHMTHGSIVYIQIEALVEGSYVEVWRRDGHPGIAPASGSDQWRFTDYPISLQATYTDYRINIYGDYRDWEDAWKFTNLGAYTY